MPLAKLPIHLQPVSREVSENAFGDVVNLFAQPPETEFRKYAASMLSTPGTEEYVKLGEGRQILAIQRYGDGLLAATDQGLFYVAPNKTVSQLIVENLASADIATNGETIAVLLNGVTWVSASVTEDFVRTNPTVDEVEIFRTVEFINGFYIFAGRRNLRAMSAGNIAWREDEFGDAERYPDGITGARRKHNELWVYGDASVEQWSANTGEGFPFRPASGLVFPHGCRAVATAVHFQNVIMWLGADRIVYRATDAGSINPVSTFAVSEKISMADTREATAYYYIEGRHIFYVLCLLEETWAYDLSTELWHRRESFGHRFHHAVHGIESFSEGLIVGSRSEPVLMRMNRRIADDLGSEIVRSIVTGPLENNQAFFKVRKVSLDLKSGETKDGLRVGLSDSDDGGATWTPVIVYQFGRRLDYSQRVIFYRRGRSRSRHMRFFFYGSGKMSVHGGYVEAESA